MSTQIIKSILSKLGESFLSKVGEHMGDNAHNNVKSIKDLELTLKTLQKNLKSLSAKAYDVEEVIKHAELSGQKKRKREVEEWLSEVKLIETEILELGREVESEGFIGRLMSGGKAAKLNEEVVKLVEQSRHFGELVVDVCGTRGETLLTTRMVGGAFEQNLERILMLLESREVWSIGVHGMGGAGKTTLAKHVHNRLLEKSQVVWVTVSQEFTVKSLQDKIARFLDKNLLVDEDEEDMRAARLNRALSQQKSSVLILDDVWEYIDLVKLGCPVSGDCCRLLVTTRSLEVCRQIGCEKVIAVKELHEDDSWKLFKETLTLGKEINLGPEVEKIAKCVARLCDGLPLGIITLAASMRGETTIHTWRNAFEELKASIAGQDEMGEVDQVFKVLKYSFDRLKYRNHVSQSNEFNSIQLCFLYCSLYPEDYKIQKKELVRNLICEELLDKRSSRREQVNLGHSILDKLVKVCLLESCVDGYFDESVKMHDLVRGMALKIGGGKYMVRAGDESLEEIPMEEEWTQDLEKVSLMRNGIRRIGEGTSPNCPKLSTLLLQYNRLLEVIPDSFFSKMQVLSTLDLSSTDIKTLPGCLSDMKSLKALILCYCRRLEDVPYLGKLKALRELDLSYTAIKEVPQGVEELLNLKFLSLRDARKLKGIRRGLLLKLVRLQCVRFPMNLHGTTIDGIENLKQLEEFEGRMRNEHEFHRFITRRVHKTSYRIRVGSVVHECWSPYYKKAVRMNECNVKEEVQKYDEKEFGPDIVSLFIRKCEGLSKFLLDDFSPSNYPRSLESLAIHGCGGIEWIFTSEQELQISRLEYIWLDGLGDLKGVTYRGEIRASAVFSSLRSLQIRKCNKMRKLGLSVLAFQNLEYIQISQCDEIEEIFEDEVRGEEEDGEGRSIALPKLKNLILRGLPRLKSVCKATINCDSINTIMIKECPRLMKLPLHLEMDVPPPPTLTLIQVEREWWESLEWDNPNLPHSLQPLLQF